MPREFKFKEVKPRSHSPERTIDILRMASQEMEKYTILDRIHPPEHLQRMHEQVALQTWEDFHTKRNGTSANFHEYLTQLDEKAQSLVHGTKPWMRVPPKVLEKILADGRIKSYFETKTSCGYMEDEEDALMRIDVEYGLFNYETNLNPQRRPLYGYITDRSDGSVAQDKVKQYGSVAICFKEHIKHRTTVTIDDSLAQTDGKNYLNVKPTPYNRPTKDMFLVGPGQRDPLTYQNIHEVRRYPEAQFHGDLQSRDIEKVVFRDSTYPSSLLIASLNKNGILYEIVNG